MRFKRFYHVFKQRCLNCHADGGAGNFELNLIMKVLIFNTFGTIVTYLQNKIGIFFTEIIRNLDFILF